jgi:hypothetical protein
MKRLLFRVLGSVVLALGISLTAPVLAQETVVHPPDPLLFGVFGPSCSYIGYLCKSNSLSGNSVTFNSGAVEWVYGATNHVDSEIVTNNQVFINGGAAGGVSAGTHYSGRNDKNYSTSATGNSVTISGGTVYGGDIDGGFAWSRAVATASSNNVTVNGGTMGAGSWITGGYALASTTAIASNNSVIISGKARWMSAVSGGYAIASTTAIASNNSVTISNDVMESGWVCGGRTGSEGTTTTSDNSVTIRSASPFNIRGLCGGEGKISTGNTLNLHSIGTVGDISAFQDLNFYLPTTLVAGGTMLTVTGSASIPDVTKVSVGLEGGGPPLRTGDWFILIRDLSCKPKDAVTTCDYGDFQPVSGTVGGHPYTVAKEGACLVLTIGNQQGVSPVQCTSPSRDYTGQWISADGENAWGLSVLANFHSNPHYIFVPWYTYDKEGNAAWYIFQGDVWSANDTITAGVRRYKGSPWGTMPYYNGSVSFEEVGTATLKFTSATTATFQYKVEGAERTINLDRLDGALSTDGGWSPTRGFTGQWAKADEYAWGLTVLGGFPSKRDYLFVPWYTYDKEGNAAWYIFQGESRSYGTGGVQNPTTITEMLADVYRYTGSSWGTMPYDNDRITSTKVGTAKLIFNSPLYSSAATARFEYDVDGESRTIELRRLE